MLILGYLDPNNCSTGYDLSIFNGGLSATTRTGYLGGRALPGLSSGKRYCEVKLTEKCWLWYKNSRIK